MDQVAAPELAAMTVRICWAQAAEVKSGPTWSTRIRSLMVLSVRRWRIFWYSGELYQLLRRVHVGELHQNHGAGPVTFQRLDLGVEHEPFAAVGEERGLYLFQVHQCVRLRDAVGYAQVVDQVGGHFPAFRSRRAE